jgi:hypothetical protein
LLSHQNPICIPLRPHSCWMPCQSHPSWLSMWSGTGSLVTVAKEILKYNVTCISECRRSLDWLLDLLATYRS